MSIQSCCDDVYHTHSFFSLLYIDCEDGMVRLVNGTSDILYQAVEECVSGRWHPVCADFWNARDGDVTCRQLGSTRQHGYNGASTEDNNMLISRQCNGGENMLRNCTRRMRSICSSGPVSIRCSPLSGTYAHNNNIIV